MSSLSISAISPQSSQQTSVQLECKAIKKEDLAAIMLKLRVFEKLGDSFIGHLMRLMKGVKWIKEADDQKKLLLLRELIFTQFNEAQLSNCIDEKELAELDIFKDKPFSAENFAKFESIGQSMKKKGFRYFQP